MRSWGKAGLSRFIGSPSSIVHLIRTVYDVLPRSTARNGRINGEQARGELVPVEYDRIVEPAHELVSAPGTRSRVPSWRPEETIDDTMSGPPSVDLDSRTRWTKRCFKNWHPAFTLPHGPEVKELFTMTRMSNISEADSIIIQAMVSVSMADSRRMGITTKQYRRA